MVPTAVHPTTLLTMASLYLMALKVNTSFSTNVVASLSAKLHSQQFPIFALSQTMPLGVFDLRLITYADVAATVLMLSCRRRGIVPSTQSLDVVIPPTIMLTKQHETDMPSRTALSLIVIDYCMLAH